MLRCIQNLAILLRTAAALTPSQWRSQSIYQILTDRFALTNGSTTQTCSLSSYCGGTWQGITNKLDYIQGMGFTAVWISPVVKNLDNSAYGRPYHGYWATDLYSLNPAFGTAADLKALSSALHARGMYLMVDIVANHVGFAGPPSKVQYSAFNPFNDVRYYHSYCPIDYNNATSTTQCWMGDTTVSLPDYKTEDAAVQAGLNAWITELVANYSIDGLRLDSAKQVKPAFWPGFVSAAGVYSIGEVIEGDPQKLCPWQGYLPGVLNYAAWYWVTRAFTSSSSTMTELANNIPYLNSVCSDTTLLGNFLENHDQARFSSITSDAGLLQNAIGFTILNDGIPIIYYGQEQGFSGVSDPNNREALWPSQYNNGTAQYGWIAALNRARKVAITKDATYASTNSKIIYSDSKVVVTSKGATGKALLSLFNDYGSSGGTSVTITAAKSGSAANTTYMDLLTCTAFTTDTSGNLVVSVVNGRPRALFPNSLLSSGDPCIPVIVTASTRGFPTATTTAITTETAFVTITAAATVTITQTGTITVTRQGVLTVTETAFATATATATTTAIITTTTTSTTTSSTKSPPSSTLSTTSCATGTSAVVTFNTKHTTQRLESIKITGSISQLGSWNASRAIAMSATRYTNDDPIWNATISLPVNTYFEYKFIEVDGNGVVRWEADPNRNLRLPNVCSGTAEVDSIWQE